MAIMKYLGSVHKLEPEDPYLYYKGEEFCEFVMSDFWKLFYGVIMPANPESKEKALNEMLDKHIPNFFSKLEESLDADKKWICGDQFTWFDMIIGGVFTNMLLNPNAGDKDAWAEVYGKAPKRVNQYVIDFYDAMKIYLATRK